MDGEHELQELLNQATYVWNQRENARGYSPYQHALGRMPDTDGRLFEARTHDMPLGLMFDPEGEIEVAQQLRNQAEKVFIDWQLQEKLQNLCALHSIFAVPPRFWLYFRDHCLTTEL